MQRDMEWRQLNHQASRIEMVLANYRVPGRVSGGIVTPFLTRFQFIPQLGTRLSRIKSLSEELALSLGVRCCHIHRRDGAIQIDIPREFDEPVRVLPLCARLATLPPCSPLIGLDEEGLPLLLSLPSADVSHVLISGMTGSGKTAQARAMIASLVISNHQGAVQLAMIDLKGRGLGIFEGLPHLLWPVAAGLEEAVAVLRMLIKEMERRDRGGIIAPRIVLFVDELAELMMQGGKEVEEALTRLMQRGREAGIHLVACTQKPLAGVIGSLVKANFPARVVGKVASAEDARVAAGISGSGAEQLKGKGEFVVIAGGSQVRVQGAWISEEEIRKLVRLLQAGRDWRGSRSEYSRRCRVALAACARE